MTELEQLTRNIDRFPTIPQVALKVMRELESPECDLEQVAEMITLDSVLAARVIKLANSPIFGAEVLARSAKQAVVRLGTKETRNTIQAVAVMNTLPELPDPLNVIHFWSLGLGTALSARHLAHELEYASPDSAYLAGLVHALGEAYLAIEFTDRYRAAITVAWQNGQPIEAALQAEFEVSTAELSARILQAWEFPADVIEGVQYHLQPDAAPQEGTLAALVFAGDRMSRDLRLGPEDPSHQDQVWSSEISAQLVEQLVQHGYPDISFYLMEQHEFMRYVSDTVHSTFA